MKKYALAAIVIIALLLGFTYVYFSVTDQSELQVDSETNNVELSQQNNPSANITVPTSNTEPQNASEPLSLSGTCVQGASSVPVEILSMVQTRLGYSMSNHALFSCALNDGTFVAGGADNYGFWSHDFEVIHFDTAGNKLRQFSKNDETVRGGEIQVGNVTSGIFNISHRVIDPCYDATFTFTFNLNTGKYTEDMKGGDDAKCWEELNSRGGV